MSRRGQKLRSAENSHPSRPGIVRHETLASPSELSPVAQAEYDRLIGVLTTKGTIDRVDLSTIAECARIKAALDALYKTDPDLAGRWSIARAGTLTTQRRGLLRELGLTLLPSRSMVRTNPVPAEEDPIASLIKLSG